MMIFLVFFGFIAVIFLSLNWFDSSNLAKLEEYIKTQNCPDYIYSKGSYKAVCSDKILEMKNSLVIDLEANKVVYLYKDIKDVKVEKNDILLNGSSKLQFNTKEDLEYFYNKLKEKVNK